MWNTRKYILIVLSSMSLTCISDDDKPEIPFLESITIDAFEGDSIVIEAKPNIGWEFSHWVINNDSINFEIEYSFIMPPNDLNFVAVFIEDK